MNERCDVQRARTDDGCFLSDEVQLADGDVMKLFFAGFGRALCNPLRAAKTNNLLVTVRPLA